MATRDPRFFQIAVLSSLLFYGLLALDFEVRWGSVALLLAAAQLTQWVGARLAGIPYDPKSPLISALSLALLLRAASWPWLVAGAVVTIGSKFVFRWRGKHVFNPTNFGLVILLLATPHLPGGAWVSPGQWGREVLFLFFLLAAGHVVLRRATRSDVTWAFLGAWSAIVFGRALWLGDPLTLPVHGLADGALLIFAFFMISDPKTTPDSRAGRIVFAVAVAAVGAWGRFGLYETDALLYALAGAALFTPSLDRLFPATRYRWPGTGSLPTPSARPQRAAKETPVPRPSVPRPAIAPSTSVPTPARVAGTVLALLLAAAGPAAAFCGFYVARAESDLFNQASRVVIARDGDRTVLTMANDFQGEPKEFAMVIPVPTFLEREQIHVGNMAAIDHLDAYTAPRLVEYHDDNPCYVRREMEEMLVMDAAVPAPTAAPESKVRIEASYTIGEYDILILSADESDGLVSWLRNNGYRIPDGAEPVVASYLKQDMRFFVAKVNLEQKAKLGFQMLRPLQIAFETPRFGLPIRLGTLNANGPQELFVYTLTRQGRVETTNYRTVKLPSDVEIPPYVRDDFADFYRDMFGRQVEKQGMRTVFLEYAWDMAWCDPCAAAPLSAAELRDLGVFWLNQSGPRTSRPAPGGGPQNVFVTRLHVRYDREHFPQDLQFQETADRTNFQGRYILRNAWTGSASCEAADRYRSELAERREREAETLAELTGWKTADIRDRMGLTGEEPAAEPWWRRLWPGR